MGAGPCTHPWGSCLAAWAQWRLLPSCGYSEPSLVPDPEGTKAICHRATARALGKRKGQQRPQGSRDGAGWGMCRTLTLRLGERTGSKRWSRKPSRLPEVRDSPVGPEEGYYRLLRHGASCTPIPSILSISVCPLPALPVRLLLGSGGAGPGGGPGGSKGAWTPGAGGMFSALQETVAQLRGYLGRAWCPGRGEV